MEATNYTNIGPVLQLNKAGELTQKRMKAVKACDGLYITEPDKSNFVRFIIECNGVMWVESSQSKSYVARYAAMMPEVLKKVKAGFYNDAKWNNYCREIDRRINHPDSPAIMELKKPERKKPVPLAENERKVSVYMFKGCSDEKTDKKVVITEVAPHVYTYAYKLKNYGERVKIILEVDGVYFEACDKGSYITEREDFTEVCRNAGEHARKNVADGAASGMAYFIEVQKRIDAATPTETPQISTETVETTNVSAEAKQGENEAGMPKYTIYNRDGYTWVVFERGIIRQCAKRSGVSCKCAEWDTIAQAYNGVHSSMGFGNYFFFDSEADAIRFAELVAEGDVCGYWKLYMANLKAEIEAKKQRIAEECAEFDEAQAYFAEIDAGRIAQSLTTPPTPPDEPTIHPADKTPTERTETAEAVNVSVEGEKGAEMAENKPYYTHRWRVLHNCDLKTWDKFHKKHKEAILIFHHDTTYAALQKEAVKVSGMCGITYKVNRHGVEVCLFNDATLAQIIGQGIYVAIAELPEVPDYGLTQPPQSPEIPQTVEYTTDTPKPRETAEKRQNRAIGSAQHHQHSALGANGYAVLNDASATMAAMSVPRERSTAEAAYW